MLHTNPTFTSKKEKNAPYEKEARKILEDLKTDINGLTDEEAKKRKQLYGANRLTGQKKETIFQLFLGHLNDPLIYVLLSAVAITSLMGEYIDSIVILAVVILNAVLGVVQEVRAGNAIEALQDLATPKALVKRDGKQTEINSEELVPGDIVILDAGRYVPADLRLLEAANLKIEESVLTGESVAVEKDAQIVLKEEYVAIGDRVNMAFMSTLVAYGRGIGIVVNTGNTTEVGKIADSINSGEKVRTPLEIRLGELGKTLGKIAIAICIIMFVIAYFQGRDIPEMFLTAVSLAVASIPEGLAAIVAIVLSIGVTKMAKRNAIIKKLPAVETLGAVNVICSDKTGTLTQNKMTVAQYYTFSDGTTVVEDVETPSAEGCLLAEAMILSSDATYQNGTGTGDPTEIALLMLGDDIGIDRIELNKDQPRIDELAFDSNRKMMSTLHKKGENHVIYAKGALDSLMLHCTHIIEEGEIIPFSETHRHLLTETADTMSDKALRILAVAYKPVETIIPKEQFEQQLVMIGIVGMIDPPRPEVKDAIKTAENAGVMTVMITGDHRNTAFAIAKELGIATDMKQTITGADINMLSEQELMDKLWKYRVFARVSPEHKVNIVKAFKAHGNIVSMTGDGVNDAPSLNTADIGVAMGITGTDVAKNASDMILSDDNFSTIVTAIEEGRNIYNNIKKSVVFLLSSNLGEVIAMLVSISIGMPVPLIATQLLWINLVTDTLPAVALGLDPGEDNVMEQPPRKPNEGFFANGTWTKIIFGGLLIGGLTIIAFWLGYYQNGYSPFDATVPEDVHTYSRTLAFMTIIAGQLFYSLSFRHNTRSIFKAGLFSNVYLIGAVTGGFLLQAIVLYIPFMSESFKLAALDVNGWLLTLGLGIIPLAGDEIRKLFKN